MAKDYQDIQHYFDWLQALLELLAIECSLIVDLVCKVVRDRNRLGEADYQIPRGVQAVDTNLKWILLFLEAYFSLASDDLLLTGDQTCQVVSAVAESSTQR